MSAPTTAAGKALLEQWPFTFNEQTCCAYPHRERSAMDDVFPDHERTTERRHAQWADDAILAIETQAAEQANRAPLADAKEALERLRIPDSNPDYATRYGRGYNDAIRGAIAALDRVAVLLASKESQG